MLLRQAAGAAVPGSPTKGTFGSPTTSSSASAAAFGGSFASTAAASAASAASATAAPPPSVNEFSFSLEFVSGRRLVFSAPTFWEMQTWVLELSTQLLCRNPAEILTATIDQQPTSPHIMVDDHYSLSDATAESSFGANHATTTVAAIVQPPLVKSKSVSPVTSREHVTGGLPAVSAESPPWHWGSLTRAAAEQTLMAAATLLSLSAGEAAAGVGLFLTRAQTQRHEDLVISVVVPKTPDDGALSPHSQLLTVMHVLLKDLVETDMSAAHSGAHNGTQA